MSKQLEAELRADKALADAAVDAAMVLLQDVAEAAIGGRIVPRTGVSVVVGGPVQPELAVVMTPIPYELMKTISTALKLWRASKETVQ